MKEHNSFEVPRHIIHSSDPCVKVIRLDYGRGLVCCRITQKVKNLYKVAGLLVLITDGVSLSRLFKSSSCQYIRQSNDI